MILKFLQLNINADSYLERLIDYLTFHNFDVIHLQEVTGKNTISGNINSRVNVYEELQKTLDSFYNSELSISSRYSSDPVHSYMGNAIFYKKEYKLVEKNVLHLHTRAKPFPSELNTFEDVGRSVIHLKLDINGKLVLFINTHLAWAKTPEEEPHQTKQGEKFINYLETVKSPFILSGDFNLDPRQPTIQKINKLARNLINENHVANTLNPRTHRAKMLFPKGVAIDYIYVTNDLAVKNFSLVEEDISDHLGLTAKIII